MPSVIERWPTSGEYDLTEQVLKRHPAILVSDASRYVTPRPPMTTGGVGATTDARFWPTVDEVLANLYCWTDLTRRTRAEAWAHRLLNLSRPDRSHRAGERANPCPQPDRQQRYRRQRCCSV